MAFIYFRFYGSSNCWCIPFRRCFWNTCKLNILQGHLRRYHGCLSRFRSWTSRCCQQWGDQMQDVVGGGSDWGSNCQPHQQDVDNQSLGIALSKLSHFGLQVDDCVLAWSPIIKPLSTQKTREKGSSKAFSSFLYALSIISVCERIQGSTPYLAT